MKRRTNLIIAAVGLGALLTVGGTMAWFTSTETFENTISVKGWDVDGDEPDYDPDPEVVPGAEFDKNPTVTNNGDIDAYVEFTIAPKYDDDHKDLDIDMAKYSVTDTGDDGWMLLEDLGKYWGDQDGYEYAWDADKKILKVYKLVKAHEAFTVFERVQMSDQMGNEYQGAVLTIDVTYRALQAEGNQYEEYKDGTKTLAKIFEQATNDGVEFEKGSTDKTGEGSEGTDQP